MCVTSMIMEHYGDKWQGYVPPQPCITFPIVWQEVSRAEFDELKRDLHEMKELLKRAKRYDDDANQPDCEHADKIALIRKLAELVGVDADDVLEAVK